MAWLQISVHTDKASCEYVENVLLNHGACSVTLKDAADEPILEPGPGETPVWKNAIITGLFEQPDELDIFIADIKAFLQGIKYHIDTNTLEDQNWTRAWMDHYQPMQFGKRLWVCPWHIEPPESEAINLRLDPGLAFGTGTHPTTALCLGWLDTNIKHQQTLLDFGCGSGILAIAGLMLGVQQADGVDIDPQALEASRQNAKANRVDERLTLYTNKELDKKGTKQYDIVIANILSGPLVDLAPTLAAYTKPGGDIVLSGILREQANDVLDAYNVFFTMDAPVYQDDWVLLYGCRSI